MVTVEIARIVAGSMVRKFRHLRLRRDEVWGWAWEGAARGAARHDPQRSAVSRERFVLNCAYRAALTGLRTEGAIPSDQRDAPTRKPYANRQLNDSAVTLHPPGAVGGTMHVPCARPHGPDAREPVDVLNECLDAAGITGVARAVAIAKARGISIRTLAPRLGVPEAFLRREWLPARRALLAVLLG